MKRTGTPTFVPTLPLVVKPGEGWGLIGCMEAGRRLYNATLDEALRRHSVRKQSKAGQHARTLSDKKASATEFNRLSKEAGFTPAALITFARSTLSTWVSMDQRAHGKLANQILGLGNIIQSETLSYVTFQKNYGKSVKVRAPGMFVEQLRRKAESAGGKLVDWHTWSLKMSQYDHTTQICTKKPLSQRWHVLGDGSGVVQRDVYSAFLARCVMSNTHHPSHLETMWAAQKPVLLHPELLGVDMGRFSIEHYYWVETSVLMVAAPEVRDALVASLKTIINTKAKKLIKLKTGCFNPIFRISKKYR